jgi:hypothetical protein
VDGDEAYIGVTQKSNTALDNYLGGTTQDTLAFPPFIHHSPLTTSLD